jgi:hypothetical protein
MIPNGSTWAPSDVDPTRPSVARVYDYYLGGSHNFESDRIFARAVIATMPEIVHVARDNREFLRRVVSYLRACGIDQFLDLGSGIPTVGNVHEVAQDGDHRARVVYVDHDPIAVMHSRALLAGNNMVTAIPGDIRDPGRVLAAAVDVGTLDLDRPVAILLISVLHFVTEADRPAEFISRYLAAVASGSYLAISHGRHDGAPAAGEAAEVYRGSASPSAVTLRSHREIQDLFAGLDMVDPGLVVMPRWGIELADGPHPGVDDGYPFLAGVGRKP